MPAGSTLGGDASTSKSPTDPAGVMIKFALRTIDASLLACAATKSCGPLYTVAAYALDALSASARTDTTMPCLYMFATRLCSETSAIAIEARAQSVDASRDAQHARSGSSC